MTKSKIHLTSTNHSDPCPRKYMRTFSMPLAILPWSKLIKLAMMLASNANCWPSASSWIWVALLKYIHTDIFRTESVKEWFWMLKKLEYSNLEMLLLKLPPAIQVLDWLWHRLLEDINVLFACPKKCQLKKPTFYVDLELKLSEPPIKLHLMPQNLTYLFLRKFTLMEKLFYSINTVTPQTQLVRKILNFLFEQRVDGLH